MGELTRTLEVSQMGVGVTAAAAAAAAAAASAARMDIDVAASQRRRLRSSGGANGCGCAPPAETEKVSGADKFEWPAAASSRGQPAVSSQMQINTTTMMTGSDGRALLAGCARPSATKVGDRDRIEIEEDK